MVPAQGSLLQENTQNMKDEQISRHALVIGGTGMLAAVCTTLAKEGWLVAVIGRSVERHQALREASGEAKVRIKQLVVDFQNEGALMSQLRDEVRRHGPFQLVVHYTFRDRSLAIARLVSRAQHPILYVHVLSSSAAHPTQREPSWQRRLRSFPGIEYRRVVLGFVSERGRTRWLTHTEICQGVLKAIRHNSPSTNVGEVSHWKARPP